MLASRLRSLRILPRTTAPRPLLRHNSNITKGTGKDGAVANVWQKGVKNQSLDTADLLGPSTGKTEVQAYDENGFVVNGVEFLGPVALLPAQVFHWKVDRVSQITKESLAIINLVFPPPKIVFVGCGNDVNGFDRSISSHFAQIGISVEPMSSVRDDIAIHRLTQHTESRHHDIQLSECRR